MRESGSNGGSVSVSKLKAGTTFDAVFPSLHIQASGGNAIVDWSDPTLGIESATKVVGPYQAVADETPAYASGLGTNAMMFFRFTR